LYEVETQHLAVINGEGEVLSPFSGGLYFGPIEWMLSSEEARAFELHYPLMLICRMQR
jgi:hypothetical protein